MGESKTRVKCERCGSMGPPRWKARAAGWLQVTETVLKTGLKRKVWHCKPCDDRPTEGAMPEAEGRRRLLGMFGVEFLPERPEPRMVVEDAQTDGLLQELADQLAEIYEAVNVLCSNVIGTSDAPGGVAIGFSGETRRALQTLAEGRARLERQLKEVAASGYVHVEMRAITARTSPPDGVLDDLATIFASAIGCGSDEEINWVLGRAAPN